MTFPVFQPAFQWVLGSLIPVGRMSGISHDLIHELSWKLELFDDLYVALHYSLELLARIPLGAAHSSSHDASRKHLHNYSLRQVLNMCLCNVG